MGLVSASVLNSSGRGIDRLFSVGDLLSIVALRMLRSAGFPLSEAAHAVRYVNGLSLDVEDEKYMLLRPDGTFDIVEAADLGARVGSVASTVIVLLRLESVRHEVIAGISEWALTPRPRRGRKPGQRVRKKVSQRHGPAKKPSIAKKARAKR